MTDVLDAPAKLTRSLAVVGRRRDGYHLIEAEMVALDLCDSIAFDEGDGLTVVDATGLAPGGTSGQDGSLGVPRGEGNLVRRALASVGRRANVVLTKRIPPGAGLGGGSSDAAAVLRWAGCTDLRVAASIGADVPFCVVGGRAHVSGAGETVEPLADEELGVVLLIPPLPVSTQAVFAAWDALRDAGDAGPARSGTRGVNDLARAALCVEPRLALYRDRLADLTGRTPSLAGSGGTWFVEGTVDADTVTRLGTPGARGAPGARGVHDAARTAMGGLLIEARSVPARGHGP